MDLVKTDKHFDPLNIKSKKESCPNPGKRNISHIKEKDVSGICLRSFQGECLGYDSLILLSAQAAVQYQVKAMRRHFWLGKSSRTRMFSMVTEINQQHGKRAL